MTSEWSIVAGAVLSGGGERERVEGCLYSGRGAEKRHGP